MRGGQLLHIVDLSIGRSSSVIGDAIPARGPGLGGPIRGGFAVFTFLPQPTPSNIKHRSTNVVRGL